LQAIAPSRQIVIPESHNGEAPSISEDVEVDQYDKIYTTDKGSVTSKYLQFQLKVINSCDISQLPKELS